MYRRIELINEKGRIKGGLMSGYGDLSGKAVNDIFFAWANELPGPKGKGTNKNNRYFFTEFGWNRLGRRTIAACLRYGQKFRIVKIKEKSVDILYKDKYQVAVRPRKYLI